jgi:hypothetical protein
MRDTEDGIGSVPEKTKPPVGARKYDGGAVVATTPGNTLIQI